MKKILVFGGAGYVGSELVPELLANGYFVKVFDTFWYGDSQFKILPSTNLELIKADIRDVKKVQESLSDVDIVIHLACISNDPSFDLDPSLGKSINLDSFRPIISSINNSNVERFIYASSSSVYGIRDEEHITENLSPRPLTDYSKFKSECEKIMLDQLSDQKTSVIVRPATVCGFSSRQRFDLVVNILTAHAIINRKIKVFGGTQFRPNLHIKDMVRAYVKLVNAEHTLVHKETFNVGSKNLTVREIAEAVQQEIDKNLPIEFLETNDLRSYRIDSSKVANKLNFTPLFNVNDAVRDLRNNFATFGSKNVLENPQFINILRMKELNLG